MSVSMKEDAYIFDIDGTLSDITHRLKYIKNTPKDWKLFFENIGKDKPKFDVINTLHQLRGDMYDGYKIVLATGRHEKYREVTKKWLSDNNVFYDDLFMRKDDDFREDSIIKEEMYHEKIKPRYDIIGVFDDRTRVVEMWRRIGLTCFQVQKGDY